MRTFHPWLAVASAIAFLQAALLTPRRSFSVAAGLRFLGLGMVCITGLILPLELFTQWASGCTNSRDPLACQELGLFPDPLIEEAARIAVLVAGVVVVRAYRTARLSDLVFWAVCVNIGAGFVEDTLRYAAAGGVLGQQQLLLSGLGDLDRSHVWRFPFTLLPGGFHHPQARGLDVLGAGPEFGWFVTGVVAAVGLWLALRGGRGRLPGVALVGVGLVWASFDHAMFNQYLAENSLFGIVLGGSASASRSPWLRLWALLGQGHLLRVAFLAALAGAFAVDELAYARAEGQRFGARWLGELERAVRYLRARSLGLALQLNLLDRRLAALVVAPRINIEAAAAVASQRLLLEACQEAGRPPPAWRRLRQALRARAVPVRGWLRWAIRLGAFGLALAVLTGIGSGRLRALGWVGVPGLLWLALGVLVAALAVGIAEAIPAARRGDGGPLLAAALGLVGIGLFVALPAVGQALWNLPPAHFIDQLRDFLQALGSGDLGRALGALTVAVGAGLAALALLLAGVAGWWSDDVAPALDSKRWLIYGLAALAIVAGTMFPAAAPVLLPLGVALARGMLLADLATQLAPAVRDVTDTLGLGLVTQSYRAAGRREAADSAQRRFDAAFTELGRNAPGYVRQAAVDYVLRRVGGRLRQELPGVARLDEQMAMRVEQTGIERVGGRRPINSDYRGRVYDGRGWNSELATRYPDGVRFTDAGFPDFSPYARARVRLDGLTGSYDTDASMANRAVGLSQTPTGHVWHHVEDGTTMILIPRDLHAAIRHTGGSAVIRHGRPPTQ
jgi:hypothetical protein